MRPHVGVLVESAPDGKQQAVQRGVIRDFGVSHRAEQYGIAGLEEIDGARRHHAAPAKEVARAPVEILERERDVMLLCDLFQNAFCRRDDFRAHPVAGNHRYCEGLHGSEHNCSRNYTGT